MPSSKSHHCKSCSYSAGSQRMLARHVAMAHSSTVYRCPICPFVSCYKANFYRHKRVIHGMRQSYCELCGYSAPSIESLTEHQETAHPDVCGKPPAQAHNTLTKEILDIISNKNEFVSGAPPAQLPQKSLKGTTEVIHIESSPEAIDVNVEFDETLTELVEVQPDDPPVPGNTSVMELVPLKVRRQYTCTCGLSTTNPREFLAHRRDEHGENINIFECQFCIYATKNVQKLYRHCALVHKQMKDQVSIVESPKKLSVKKSSSKISLPTISNLSEQRRSKIDSKILKHSQVSSTNMNFPSYQNKSSQNFSNASQVHVTDDVEIEDNYDEEYMERQKPSLANKNAKDKFKCRNCSFTSKSKVLLMRHEKTVHLRKKFYRCQLCDYVCHEKGRYTKHVKYHSLPKTKCEFCDFETPYKWNLDRHLKSHELGGQFQCDKCSFTAHNRQSITVHLANHHSNNNLDASNAKTERSPLEENLDDTNQSFQDDEDNEEADKEPDELEDILPQGEDGDDLMDDGEEIDEDSDDPDMQDWNNDYSYENEEPYRPILRCSFCSFKTIWPQALNRHEAAHKVRKKYPCHFCGAGFDSLAWLSRHLAQKHRQNVHPKNLNKMFTTKKKVMFKPPSGNMPLKSMGIQRQKRFRDLQFMNKYPVPSSQSSVLYNKPKDIRSKISKEDNTVFSNDLVYVRPAGSGKPINICRVCGYKTRWVSEMEKHLRVHSDKKPYSCPCCMYKCKWKGDLKRHVFKYHGEHALSLVQEPEIQSAHRSEMSESSWTKQRFKPAAVSSPYRSCGPKEFYNGGKTSQWRRVPPSKNSNTILKLTKLSDQDSPLDLTTPRRSDFDDSNSDIQELPDEDDDTFFDEEPYNEGFSNEWPNFNDGTNDMEEIGMVNATLSQSKFRQKAQMKRNVTSTEVSSNNASKSRQYSNKNDLTTEKQVSPGSGFVSKRYKCTYCPFMSKTASRFHVHIIQHLNKKPFMCSTCGYKSNWEWDITKHIKIKGLRDESHANAEMHITDESGLKNYEKYNKYLVDIGSCAEDTLPPDITSPEQTTGSVDNVLVMPDILGNMEPSDVLPTDMMETEFSVCDQGSSNSPRVFKCKHCSFTHNEKKAVIGHLGVHAGLKPYRCKLCGMMSNWKHVIIRHVKLRHGGEMKFVEDRISYVQEGDTIKLSGITVEGKSIAIVQKTDTSRTVFPCALCPYTCEKHYYMQFHMKQHKPRPDANMKCPLCPYWVKFKKTLTKHMKLHELPAYVPYQTPDDEVVQSKDNEYTKKENSLYVNKVTTSEKQTEIVLEKPKKPKRHVCDVCPYATNNMTQMLYHKQFHRQNKNASFKCNTCSYWSTHNHLIIQHMKLHINMDTFNGPLSSTYTVNKPNIGNPAKKMKLDTGVSEIYQEPEIEYKFSCTMCSYHCNDQQSLSTHYKFHQVVNTEFMEPEKQSDNTDKTFVKPKGFTYFCKDCPAMFKSRSDYNTHTGFHGAWLPFSCPQCSYKAKHKPHLHKHLHVHSDAYVARRESLSDHPNAISSVDIGSSGADLAISNEKALYNSEKLTVRLGVKQLKCTACPAVFYKHATFEYHKSLHGSSGEQKCSMCTYAINSVASLNKHLELHHKQLSTERKNSIKIFNCPKCPAFFTKQARFDKHLSLHGQNNKYTCDHCDYSVKFAANLIKHKVVHSGVPPILPAVPSPEKISSNEASPVAHDIVSSPPPPPLPPPLPITKTASSKSEVKETKKKVWYSCSRCPYSQTRKDAVQSHLRRHGVIDDISCPHCDYCTMQTSFLREHIKRHFQPIPYLKIEAFMKYGPMEVWALDSEEQELVFKFSGDDNEADKFYPRNEDEFENKSDSMFSEEKVSDDLQQQDDLQQSCVSIPSTTEKGESTSNHRNVIQLEVENTSCNIDVSEINGLVNETIKKKLIEDALRKTKKLEIVLTDVLHEKKSLFKSSTSDGKFKIPDLNFVDVAGKVEKTLEEVNKEKKKLLTEISNCDEECTSLEENIIMDGEPSYYEGVEEEYSGSAVQDIDTIIIDDDENTAWDDKRREEPMLMDVMLSGEVYSGQPENEDVAPNVEDAISDKDSDETLPIEDTLLDEVSEGNLHSESQKEDMNVLPLPMEDPLLSEITIQSVHSGVPEKDSHESSFPINDSLLEDVTVEHDNLDCSQKDYNTASFSFEDSLSETVQIGNSQS